MPACLHMLRLPVPSFEEFSGTAMVKGIQTQWESIRSQGERQGSNQMNRNRLKNTTHDTYQDHLSQDLGRRDPYTIREAT